MTTIAWDGKTLAADKMSGGGQTFPASVTKIFTDGHLLVGCAGASDFCAAMVDWVLRGRKADDFPAHQRTKEDFVVCLVIEGNGTPIKYFQTSVGVRYEIGQKLAIGSGEQIAATCMFLGKSAKEAVEIAAHLDTCTGLGVDTLSL